MTMNIDNSSHHGAAEAGPSTLTATQQQRTRFFPPPFRIDLTRSDDEDEGDGETQGRTLAAAWRDGAVKREESDDSFGVEGVEQPSAAGAGMNRQKPKRPPKKKRRLLFTSELPPPPTHHEDGTPSVLFLRYQSTLRLKHKWESIYERFKDAHLIKQDEIYLGRGKEKIRLLRDNGVIRALKGECSFGSFHIKEEDLDAVERELRRASGEDVDALMPPAGARGKGQSRSAQDGPDGSGQGVDSDEDELGVWDPDFVRTQYREFDGGEGMRRSTSRKISGGNSGADTSGSTAAREDSEEEEEDDRPMDPDLIAFLEAEAKRKEIMGGEEDEDDEDEVVDFRSPRWTNKARWTGSGSTSESDSTSNRSSSEEFESEEMQQRGPRRHKKGPATLHLDQPEAYESSEDEIDVLDPEAAAQVAQQRQQHRKDPYRKMMEKKRRNVERLISRQGTNGTQQGGTNCGSGGVLPYDDIPGLAELLGVTAVADASAADTSGSTGSDVSHVAGDKTAFDDAEVVDAMLLSQEARPKASSRSTPERGQGGNSDQANAFATTVSDESNNSFSSMVSVAVSSDGDKEQLDAISSEAKAHAPKSASKAPSDSSASTSSSARTGNAALSVPSPRSFGCSSSASDMSAKSPPTSPLVVTADAMSNGKDTVSIPKQGAVVPTAEAGHRSTEAGTDVHSQS